MPLFLFILILKHIQYIHSITFILHTYVIALVYMGNLICWICLLYVQYVISKHHTSHTHIHYNVMLLCPAEEINLKTKTEIYCLLIHQYTV